MPLNCETPVQTTASPADCLTRAFFERDVVDVARDCLGLVLVAQTNSGCAQGRIVEVEAYRGPDDRAAHSFGGRRTTRTEAMFGPAGHAYVFLIYGIHTHLNIVAGKVDQPQAVLIRAIEPLSGTELMQQRRARAGKVAWSPFELCNGPGKLCQALDISRRFNGRDMLETNSEPRAESVLLQAGPAPRNVATSPRIGIEYAGEWASKPWRFYDPDSPCVSRATKGTKPHV